MSMFVPYCLTGPELNTTADCRRRLHADEAHTRVCSDCCPCAPLPVSCQLQTVAFLEKTSRRLLRSCLARKILNAGASLKIDIVKNTSWWTQSWHWVFTEGVCLGSDFCPVFAQSEFAFTDPQSCEPSCCMVVCSVQFSSIAVCTTRSIPFVTGSWTERSQQNKKKQWLRQGYEFTRQVKKKTKKNVC